jgi:hypothetical protein
MILAGFLTAKEETVLVDFEPKLWRQVHEAPECTLSVEFLEAENHLRFTELPDGSCCECGAALDEVAQFADIT